MSIQDVTSLFSLVIIAIGLPIGLLQWAHANKIKRAEFLSQIIEKLRVDESTAKVMYLIEYENDWYKSEFHGGNTEKEIDQFLAYINYICYLRNMNIIKEKEFSLLRYEVNRVCQNQGVQAYLWNLYHFSQRNNAKSSFQEIIEYGIKSNILIEGFKENRENLFSKYLNF